MMELAGVWGRLSTGLAAEPLLGRARAQRAARPTLAYLHPVPIPPPSTPTHSSPHPYSYHHFNPHPSPTQIIIPYTWRPHLILPR